MSNLVHEPSGNLKFAKVDPKLVVFYLDAKCLKDGARNFGEVQDVKYTDAIEFILNPRVANRTLKTIQLIASRAYMGFKEVDKKDLRAMADATSLPAHHASAVSTVQDNGTDDKNEDNELDVTFRSSATVNKNFTFAQGIGKVSSVKQYVEPIENPVTGETTGWLIFYIVYNRDFSFDLGFDNFCRIMQLRKKKKPATQPEHMAFDKVDDWIYTALNNYTKNKFYGGTDDETEAYSNRLDGSDNPANMHKVFSLERALEHMERLGGVRRSIYMYLQGGGGYANVDETDELGNVPVASSTTYKLRFPGPAYEVKGTMREVPRFFAIDIDEFKKNKPDWDGLDPDQVAYLERVARERLDHPGQAATAFEAMDRLIDMKKANLQRDYSEWMKKPENERDPVPPPEPRAEIFRWIQTPEIEQRIQSVLSSDEQCPATVKVFDWYLEKRKQAPGGKLVLAQPFRTLIHPKLTFTGNVFARDGLKCENVLGIYTMHTEALLLHVVTLVVCDVGEGRGDVKFHFVISGPPASGKSFVLKSYGDMMIEGTVENISHVTRLGLTGEERTDGMVNLQDEMILSMGNGKFNDTLDLMKEAMTRGKIVSKQVVIDPDTKKRVTVVTVTHCSASWFGGMNHSFYSGHVDSAILSRQGKFYGPLRERDDREPVTENFARRDEPRIKKLVAMYKLEWETRQFVSNTLFVYIRLRAIPHINTMVAQSMCATMLREFHEIGFHPEVRDVFRLVICCQGVCLYSGTSLVFFSGQYFPPNTVFQVSHCLQVAPHMVCTREHFWLALGLTFPMFVNPFVDQVLEVIWDLIQEQTERFPLIRAKAGDYYDYDYFLLDISCHTLHSDRMFIMPVTAELVVRRLKKGKEVLSKENVSDTLNWLSNQGMFDSKRDYEEEDDTKFRNRLAPLKTDLIRIKTTGSAYGLEISRDFLLSYIDPATNKVRPEKSYLGIYERIVKATIPREGYNVNGKTTFVTGIPLRALDRPQYFHTIDTEAMGHGNLSRKDEILQVQSFRILKDALELEPGLETEKDFIVEDSTDWSYEAMNPDDSLDFDDVARAIHYRNLGYTPPPSPPFGPQFPPTPDLSYVPPNVNYLPTPYPPPYVESDTVKTKKALKRQEEQANRESKKAKKNKTVGMLGTVNTFNSKQT